MSNEKKAYVDQDHEVTGDYHDLREEYNANKTKSIKEDVEELIEEDPDFFDPYLLLRDILQDEGKTTEAEKVLNEAYQRAVDLVTDEEGNWPDALEWSWVENRHIIRTFLHKAISLWEKGETDEALELFRKLLRKNPRDNIGARDFILAIRMDMTFAEFNSRFREGGFYTKELMEWFEENYKDFPEEFEWWAEEVGYE